MFVNNRISLYASGPVCPPQVETNFHESDCMSCRLAPRPMPSSDGSKRQHELATFSLCIAAHALPVQHGCYFQPEQTINTAYNKHIDGILHGFAFFLSLFP